MQKIAEHYSNFMRLPRLMRYMPIWIVTLILFGHLVMFEKCWEHFHSSSYCVVHLAQDDLLFKGIAQLSGVDH